MSKSVEPRRNHVLLTGATGFLGKVVLSELLRRREMLGITQVTLLIRQRGKQSARERFDEKLFTSPCFARLPRGWEQQVAVLDADLSLHNAGISDEQRAPLLQKITHIIHCAASVDFDRPVREACLSNITSALNVLELARQMPLLQQMVSTSTAYVAPHRLGALLEKLVPLPRPAEVLYAEMQRETGHGRALLKETGHANTYTYTKCVAEHLLVERARDVPLSIVRPSIISASLRQPTAGWIDSKAAFAGFVATIGAGYLRLIEGNASTLLDIVPVDFVSDCLIKAALTNPDAGGKRSIHHATAGLNQAMTVGFASETIVSFFRRNPSARRAGVKFVGRRNRWFNVLEKVHHDVPADVATGYHAVTRNLKQKGRARRLKETLRTINRVFPYFTQNTFDFRSRHNLPESFTPEAYLQTVCRGVSTHLLRSNAREVSFAGQKAKPSLAFSFWPVRVFGYHPIRSLSGFVAKRLLNRIFEKATFDKESFDEAKVALTAIGSEFPVVFAPTHRSYLDFLVLGVLFRSGTNLGFVAPRPAVLQTLLDLPVAGPWLRRLGAFARGGQGTPLKDALLNGQPLQIFLEGHRSRSRAFNEPERSTLLALTRANTPVAIIPLSISYERIAEEAPFLRELRGDLSGRLTPSALFLWLQRAFAGKIHLGRVHVAAANPVVLRGSATVEEVSRQIVVAHCNKTVVSRYHLDAFLARHPSVQIEFSGLAQAIIQRGGTVLALGNKKSFGLRPKTVLDGLQERSLRRQWEHLFVPDAWKSAPRNPALISYAEALGLSELDREQALADAPMVLLRALFCAYLEEYAAVCRSLADFARKGCLQVSGPALMKNVAFLDPKNVALAIRSLLASEFLMEEIDASEETTWKLLGSEEVFEKCARQATDEIYFPPPQTSEAQDEEASYLLKRG